MGPKETKKKKITGLIMSDMLSYARKNAKPEVQHASELVAEVQNEVLIAQATEAKPSIEEVWNSPILESAKLKAKKNIFANAKSRPQAEMNFIKFEHRVQAKIFALRQNNFIGQITSFAAVCLVLAIIFQSAGILASTQSLKSAVLGTTTDAISHLQEAATLTSEQNFTDSQQQFSNAKQEFSSAKKTLSDLGIVLNTIFSLTSKGKTANMLLDAGESIALAGQSYNSFYANASQIKVTAQGFEVPNGFYENLSSARAYLEKGNNYLLHAGQDLDQVDVSQLPQNFQSQFQGYKAQLDQAVSGLTEVDSLLGLLQGFVGKGQKSVLVLFENNREMRATGGFIGTYGFYKLDDGKIVSQKISSIYDLDGQLKQKIAPPGAFHDLTDHWGLRDSNWFVDFQTSAQKAALFYEKEGLETPDAVVAITPDIFVDLLKLTGPINFPKYNLVLSADNFRDQLQLNTSTLYDKEENAPKQMLADFAPLLMQSLVQIPKDKYPDFFSLVLDNLAQKNILFYDRDPAVQSQFENYNWAGKILPTDKDYLAVFNTNLGGRKTDLDVNQSLDLKSAVQDDGSILNTLTYTRTQKINLLDPTSKNIDYVRFLVPQGSTLISAQGFTKHNFYRSDGSDYTQDNQPFTVDPDLLAMDQNSRIDALSGTVVTSESDKTEFGNWIETSPGASSTVTLQYKLPFNAQDSKKFSLLFQKQPGNNAMDFSYELDPGNNKIAWYTPIDMLLSSGKLDYKQSLKSDILIGAVFDR